MFKCRLIIVFLFILQIVPINFIYHAATNSGIFLLRSDEHGIELKVDVPVLSLKNKYVDNKLLQELSLPSYNSAEVSDFYLPEKSILLGVPSDAEINISVIDSSYSTLKDCNISSFSGNKYHGRKTSNNYDALHSKDNYYPENLAVITDDVYIRDQRIVRVEIYPVQYNPAKKEVRYYSNFIVSLDFIANKYFTGITSASRNINVSKDNASFEALYEKILFNYESAKSWRKKRGTPNASSQNIKTDWYDSGNTYYKLYIEEEGIYKLSYTDLFKDGINLSEVDPQTIKIFNKGNEIPIFVYGEEDGKFDGNDFIEFYGTFNEGEYTYEDIFTKANVYWLTYGDSYGLRMNLVNGSDSTGDEYSYFKDTLRIEKDLFYNNLSDSEDGHRDHWFWSNIIAPNFFSFSFSISDLASVSVKSNFRIDLHGATHLDVNPDHHVLVYLNNNLIADSKWDGQKELYLEEDFDFSYLKEGDNTIKVELPGDTEAGNTDSIFFNWLEVDYWKKYAVDDDYLKFSIPEDYESGTFKYTISDFSSDKIEIFNIIDMTKIISTTISSQESHFNVSFSDDVSEEKQYIALSSSQMGYPTEIVKDNPSSLKSLSNGADYIIVTHNDFLESVKPLAELREKNGFRVKTVGVEDIYDEFNFGIISPEAIKEFLSYAYNNWEPPAPSYVLLVGDANRDYKDILKTGDKTYIPSYPYYIRNYGETAVDNRFVCISGDDDLPEMAIGRLPVESQEEAEAIVNKIIDYSSSNNKEKWKKKTIFATGVWNEEEETFFEDSSESLISNYVPANFSVSKLYNKSDSVIADNINSGAVLLNYIGHSGGSGWQDFNENDIDDLINTGKFPFVVNMGCLTNIFDEIGVTDVFGESFLEAEDKGAIAFWGPASISYLYGNSYLNENLFKSIFADKKVIIGDAIFDAKISLYKDHPQYTDLINSYTLLGDPAIKLPISADESNDKISVRRISRKSGTYRNKVKIYGSGFGNKQKGLVKFVDSVNEIKAKIKSWRNNKIVVFVPWGLKPGKVKIKVILSNRDNKSINFKFKKPKCKISKIKEESATVLIIYGENFGPYEKSYSKVIINGEKVAIRQWKNSQIKINISNVNIGKKNRLTVNNYYVQRQKHQF